jgi:hypothetical protein
MDTVQVTGHGIRIRPTSGIYQQTSLYHVYEVVPERGLPVFLADIRTGELTQLSL